MRVVLVALLALALAACTPWAWANTDVCDYSNEGEVASAGSVAVDQDQHSCHGSSGSQTYDRVDVWVNSTGPVGRHNATYQSETDTGSWEPYWCDPANNARCSTTTVGWDGTNVTTIYRENADASRCDYQARFDGRAHLATTAPAHDECFDWQSLLP